MGQLLIMSDKRILFYEKVSSTIFNIYIYIYMTTEMSPGRRDCAKNNKMFFFVPNTW